MSHMPPPDQSASRTLLKSDLFGCVEIAESDDVRVIVRDTRRAAFGLRWVARALLRREARALASLDGLSGVPELIAVDADTLTRAYLDGQAMQDAKPRDPRYFRLAMRALRAMHSRAVAHNDLAKEPNLLVTSADEPAFVDFQLATVSASRGRWFRLLAREDIRHLLKHKRTYCPDALTAREREILATPAWPARFTRRVVKPLYLFVTRRLLGWADREGAGDRKPRRRP